MDSRIKNKAVRDKKGNSLMIFPDSYIVIDIETTGLNPSFNEIIEISALKIVDNQIVDEFTSLIKPKGRISKFISGFTGITNDMVKDAPPIEKILPVFYEFIGDRILVGHNINFDINFIYDNLLNYSGKFLTNEFVDTLRISRKLLRELPNRKLETIASHFDIEIEGMHRSLKDCQITHKCFLKLQELISQN